MKDSVLDMTKKHPMELEFPRPLVEAEETNLAIVERLEPMRAAVLALQVQGVKTADDYAKMGAILSDVRSIKKNEVSPLWAPFKGIVERVRDYLKVQQQKADNLCEEIDGICRAEMKKYEIAEAAATAKEQKKHPEGVVQPAIPAVVGYRRSTTYPVTVKDPKALLRELLKAYKKTDTKRVQFLAQFVMLDDKAINAHARKLADPVQFNKEMPGLVCRKEGA